MDDVANFFLMFGHKIPVFIIIIAGYFLKNKKAFFHATCLLLISMILNYALKITFQVPLSPTLGIKGFAFPSGHMQAAFVFYGWLFRSTPKVIEKTLLAVLLVGIGLSLMHFGYHDLFDVIGGVVCGLLLLMTYSYLEKKYPYKFFFPMTLGFCILLIGYIKNLDDVQAHNWMALYMLIGLMASELYVKDKQGPETVISKMIAMVFCVALIVATLKGFEYIALPFFFDQLKYLLIGAWLPLSIKLVKKNTNFHTGIVLHLIRKCFKGR